MSTSITCNISNTPFLPLNIPAQKEDLKTILDEKEINYAKVLAKAVLSESLIAKSFIDDSKSNNQTYLSRNFHVGTCNLVLRSEILNYAALIIFENLLVTESCPPYFKLILTYTGTEDLEEDPIPPMYWGDKISDMYKITLSTNV